tara:strand:+ start:252 stop:419 length:168 start_codon:yes stop_codon:yes gene_type:complete
MERTVSIGVLKSALTSVMFSVDGATAVFCTKECVTAIDKFFDDMQLESSGNPTVA